MMPKSSSPRVFGVNYQFLSAGSVFTDGLQHAAEAMGLTYAHADWADPRLPALVKAFDPDLLFVVHGRRFVQRWRASFALFPIIAAIVLLPGFFLIPGSQRQAPSATTTSP